MSVEALRSGGGCHLVRAGGGWDGGKGEEENSFNKVVGMQETASSKVCHSDFKLGPSYRRATEREREQRLEASDDQARDTLLPKEGWGPSTIIIYCFVKHNV